MRLLCFAVSLFGIGFLSLALGGCDRCSFQNLDRLVTKGTLPCCGAFKVHEVVVKAGTNRQVDLANSESPVPAGLVDLWLTPASCERLFDGPYPGSVPQCAVLIGPVAPGSVSERRKLDPGTYRVFAQSYSSNVDPVEYVGDVGVWGNDCVPGSLTAPR